MKIALGMLLFLTLCNVEALAQDARSSDGARPLLARAAEVHARATLPHVTSGDYAGEHCLASFAVYLLSTPVPK